MGARLDKALGKLTEHEKQLLTDHLTHNLILETQFKLQDEGYRFNYPTWHRDSVRDFIRITLLRERVK